MILLQNNNGGAFFDFIANYWWLLVILFIIFSGLFTVNQGHVGVITMFGKYRRPARPGLNFKIPILEQVYKKSIHPEPVSRDGVPGGNARPGECLFQKYAAVLRTECR